MEYGHTRDAETQASPGLQCQESSTLSNGSIIYVGIGPTTVMLMKNLMSMNDYSELITVLSTKKFKGTQAGGSCLLVLSAPPVSIFFV